MRSRFFAQSSIASACLILTGCAWKTGLTTGAVTTGVVGVASALSPSAIVPALAGGAAAAIVSATSAGGPEKIIHEAPETLWSVAQSAVEIGGIGLILFFLVPAIVGWLLPGPTKLNRDKK